MSNSTEMQAESGLMDGISNTSEKTSRTTAHEMSTRGWRSGLAWVVTALMLFLAVTGLWIYLAPFSRFAEMQVLFHVAAGLLVLIPYTYYQVHHFLVWYRQKSSVVMVVGYLLMGMMVTCIVSGVVVAWQAMMDLKTAPVWREVHVPTEEVCRPPAAISTAMVGWTCMSTMMFPPIVVG